MKPELDRTCTAFFGSRKIAEGRVLDVALKVKEHLHRAGVEALLIFDDLTGAQVEIDFRGSAESVVTRIRESAPGAAEKPSGPGRPKLGVISREVSLLPRHWDWLSLQPGGASAALRRLVEEAKKRNLPRDLVRRSQETAYKFMTAIAGDRPNFEEALRALFAGDRTRFEGLIAAWPKDVREHALALAEAAFR